MSLNHTKPLKLKKGGMHRRRPTLTLILSRRVARNSQWGGLFGGSGGGAPSCQRLGVWGQSPQPPEARGSGGGAPSTRKFCIFFAKITSF